MRAYLEVYKEFVKTCFAEALTYRINFVLLILMDNILYITALLSVKFLFNHVDQIGPWNESQFMFFLAFVLLVDQLHMTFVSENFWLFSYNIRLGALDFILIKPLGPLFTIFFRRMRPHTLLDFLLPFSVLIYYGRSLDYGWMQWLLIPVLVLVALTLMTSIEILISMSMFWVIEADGINFLRLQLQQLSRWPDFVYRFFARKFFTLGIPVLLVGSGPVHFLFNFSHWSLLATMLAAILVCWIFTNFFWRLGLKGYESASS